MLCLGRYEGEKIVLPEVGVTITILESKPKDARNMVRIGVMAPDDVTILREEVATRRQLKRLEMEEQGR